MGSAAIPIGQAAQMIYGGGASISMANPVLGPEDIAGGIVIGSGTIALGSMVLEENSPLYHGIMEGLRDRLGVNWLAAKLMGADRVGPQQLTEEEVNQIKLHLASQANQLGSASNITPLVTSINQVLPSDVMSSSDIPFDTYQAYAPMDTSSPVYTGATDGQINSAYEKSKKLNAALDNTSLANLTFSTWQSNSQGYQHRDHPSVQNTLATEANQLGNPNFSNVPYDLPVRILSTDRQEFIESSIRGTLTDLYRMVTSDHWVNQFNDYDALYVSEADLSFDDIVNEFNEAMYNAAFSQNKFDHLDKLIESTGAQSVTLSKGSPDNGALRQENLNGNRAENKIEVPYIVHVDGPVEGIEGQYFNVTATLQGTPEALLVAVNNLQSRGYIPADNQNFNLNRSLDAAGILDQIEYEETHTHVPGQPGRIGDEPVQNMPFVNANLPQHNQLVTEGGEAASLPPGGPNDLKPEEQTQRPQQQRPQPKRESLRLREIHKWPPAQLFGLARLGEVAYDNIPQHLKDAALARVPEDFKNYLRESWEPSMANSAYQATKNWTNIGLAASFSGYASLAASAGLLGEDVSETPEFRANVYEETLNILGGISEDLGNPNPHQARAKLEFLENNHLHNINEAGKAAFYNIVEATYEEDPAKRIELILGGMMDLIETNGAAAMDLVNGIAETMIVTNFILPSMFLGRSLDDLMRNRDSWEVVAGAFNTAGTAASALSGRPASAMSDVPLTMFAVYAYDMERIILAKHAAGELDGSAFGVLLDSTAEVDRGAVIRAGFVTGAINLPFHIAKGETPRQALTDWSVSFDMDEILGTPLGPLNKGPSKYYLDAMLATQQAPEVTEDFSLLEGTPLEGLEETELGEDIIDFITEPVELGPPNRPYYLYGYEDGEIVGPSSDIEIQPGAEEDNLTVEQTGTNSYEDGTQLILK